MVTSVFYKGLLMAQRHDACLYIDGFNIYYGLVKGTQYKWLNPIALVNQILPYIDVIKTEYFTADVLPNPFDPDKGNRQELYNRALKTVPYLEIIKGHYSINKTKLPLACDYPTKLTMVEVMKPEEKGSDVNLATHLLKDAFCNTFHTAIVISNDSDLEEPIKICTQELSKYVYVLNPQEKYPSRDLSRVATKMITIRRSLPVQCQFPVLLSDSAGTFTKPTSW